MNQMKVFTAGALVTALGLAATPAAAETVLVTNARDDVMNPPAGSFRAAVKAANEPGSAVTAILFRRNLGMVQLKDTVIYNGTQALSIDGQGARIRSAAPQAFDLFVSERGADLVLRELTFQNGDSGIVVAVPEDAEGAVSVALIDVIVRDNLRFGLLIDEEGELTSGGPSPAGISLVVASSRFVRNGLLRDVSEDDGDVDAIRVNERSDGDITAVVIASTFGRNGADGLELDEGGPGDAMLTAFNSSFDRNGLTRLGGEDGIDIDENDAGSIWLNVVGSTFNRNTDDGIGLDEAGGGDLHMTLVQVEASGNTDSGISADEGDAGDFKAKFVLVNADRNDDKGADMTEAGAGNFDGRATTSSFSSNADDGIAVEQLDAGTGVLRLVDVTLKGNANPIDATGVEVIER